MTLRPSAVTPASMKSLKPRKDRTAQPVKRMVIDCKNESQWHAIHHETINGVVLRRRPIRAIESYLNTLGDFAQTAQEFSCAQNRVRNHLNKILPLKNEDDDLRRKFLVNDIANFARILITQSRSREYLYRICPDLPTEFESDPAALKMIISYRDLDITFRQPQDKDERTFSPYGAALFRGTSYDGPVEWKAEKTSEKAFYLTIEPTTKRRRI